MALHFKQIKDYKDVRYRSFPNENREQHLTKDEKWAIAYLSTMLHRYVSGSGSELKYEWDHMKTLEKYAKGTQGAKKVKEKLLRKQKDGTFKGRMKDVFQTFDILPEMIDVILAANMKADYKAQTVAVDEMSIKDKNMEIALAKFVIEERTKNFLAFMGIKVDTPLTEEELSAFTSADIDVLYQTGGVQLQRERACVSVCNTAMLQSYHKEIENMCSFDIITYGIAATKSYWDFNENVSKYRYVDPQKLIVPSSKYNDFRNITYAGEIRMMTLAEIISECPNISHEKLDELVRCNWSYNADFGAVAQDFEGYKNKQNDIFDEYRIAVLDAQWLATDSEVRLQSPTANGGEIYKKVAEDFRIKPSKARNGQKLDRKKYVKKYEAIWVIGSDILLSYGQASNNSYYGPRGARIPKLDYNIIKTGKKSLVDRCRTIVDDINLAIAKLRSAIATLPPAPRMIVYDHALQNVKFGGILQSPKDLFDGLSEDGMMVVNGLDRKGNPINGRAVEFMNSGLAEDITIFSNEAAQKVSMLRQVLGLPEGLDGTAGQKYQLASTMNLAAAASSNALFPTTSRIGPLFEMTFDNCVRKTQAMCREKDIKVEEIGLSDRVVNVFKLSKDFSNYEFKIRITFVPTEAEQEFLLQQINEFALMNAQTKGEMGCTKAEFLMLYKLVKAGLIDEAMTRIAQIERLRNETSVKLQEANIQATIQGQQQSAAMAEQERRQTMKEAEAEKRQTELLKSMSDGINDLQKMYLSSYDKENSSIPGQIYNNLVNTNKGVVANIVSTDEQLAQQAQQPQEMPVQETLI